MSAEAKLTGWPESTTPRWSKPPSANTARAARPMTVVLDANAVLQTRAAGYAFHIIFEYLLAGRFALAVSTA